MTAFRSPPLWRSAVILATASLFFPLSFVQAQTVGDILAAPPLAQDPVVARIDRSEVKRSDVVRVLQSLPAQMRQMPIDTLYPLLLERMIDTRLMVNAARSEKLHETPDIRRRMLEHEERILQEIYLERSVRAKISDTMLEQRYEAFVKENPPQDEIHARHILVSDEKTAKAIILDLNKGQDFTKLAREKSTDDSSKEGGDLGFFTEGDMVSEFSAAAFALTPGQYTKEPIKTQFGYHIIKVEERRKTSTPSFEDVKDQMTAELSQELIAEILEGLRAKAKLEKMDFNGKPLSTAVKTK